MDEELLGALPKTIGPMKSKKFGVAVAIVQGNAYAMGQIKVDTLVDILCDVRLATSRHAGLCGIRVGGLEPLRHIGLLADQGTG